MKFKTKTAQGLSMETIIIAALAMFVLVVLILIFTGNMARLIPGFTELNKCSAKGEGARCVADKTECAGEQVFSVGCPEKGEDASKKYCCIPRA